MAIRPDQWKSQMQVWHGRLSLRAKTKIGKPIQVIPGQKNISQIFIKCTVTDVTFSSFVQGLYKIAGIDNPVNHGKSKDENETEDNLEKEPLQKIDNNENKSQPTCDSVDVPKYTQVLRDINLSIRPGNLVGVAGAIGSGKSSLISSILGEV